MTMRLERFRQAGLASAELDWARLERLFKRFITGGALRDADHLYLRRAYRSDPQRYVEYAKRTKLRVVDDILSGRRIP